MLNISKLLNFHIVDNTKYFPYFKNCLRVLDSIYLFMYILSVLVSPYPNCKSRLLQNILDTCKMNLTFCYVLAGCESYAYNNKILRNGLFNKDFWISDEKYYLINTRYYNTKYLFCLYCNVQYHLKE